MNTHDLIIIGTGSGNAIPEYLSDWKIALVEKGTFGGTCLNVGCIPSKMFVVPADFALGMRGSKNLGITAENVEVDWISVRDRVFGRIDPIAESGRVYRHEATNVELIQGTARFTGPKSIEVDGRELSAKRILIATGSRPYIPPLPGIDSVSYHTSDTIMRLDSLPERLGVLGGGFIAAEMGHVFSAFGSQVTLFTRSPAMLKSQDDEIAARFVEVFGKRVELKLGHMPTAVSKSGDAIQISVGDETTTVDELLVAVGRVPNSDLLNVEAAGLEMHEDGRLVTDSQMRTNVENVWAIGDATNEYQLKHVANAEAKVAFWNIANPDQPRTVNYRGVPNAVFSSPQIASVGLTEQAASAEGLDFVVGRKAYGETAYGWAMEDSTSFAKVLVDRSGAILGAHIIGSVAAVLIQPLIQAIALGLTVEQVASETYYIHPALSEVVENALLEAAKQLG